MLQTPFYDPQKSYEENFSEGPFSAFANQITYKEKGDPKFDFLGNPVFLPFGIPAGPLVNGKFVKAALDKGFDICVYKTVRSRRHPCHPWPNILALDIDGDLTEMKAQKGVVGSHDYKHPLSITNSFGVPSFAPDFWQHDLAETVQYAKKGQVVIGSFQGTPNEKHKADEYHKDFIRSARLVKETGVKVMEVNLSCPNEGHSNLMCYDIERTTKIASDIKDEIGNIPLLLKISYFHNDDQLKKLVDSVHSIIQGLSTINTLSAKIIDKDGNKALPGNGRNLSGVCGATIKWAGISMVSKLKKLRDENSWDFTIVGMGGVTTPDDYFDYVKSGADAVMSATGAMWNPYLAQEIKEKVLKEE